MKLNIYVIFDSCAGIYQNPFFGQSDGEATRSFGDIAQDASHPIGQHPEHYSMYRLGTYDNLNAKINLENKECIATAQELIALAKNPNPERQPELVKALAEMGEISPGGTA